MPKRGMKTPHQWARQAVVIVHATSGTGGFAMKMSSKGSMAGKLSGLPLVAALALWGCSSQQQDSEDLEASEDNQAENVGQDDAAEGNGQENYVENNEEGGNDNAGAENNADVANDTAADNPTLDNSAAAQPAPVEAAPANAAPAPAPAPAPSEGGPVAGGRVRYVKAGGAQAVNAPGGQPVGTLEEGEHPVTWEENGWLRITNGMYVPVDAMSDKGVARPGHAKASSLSH